MDMLQLKLFVSVAQTLNFSRTAELFYMTQPAVSHQIKALEKHLGTALLRRGSHFVELTAEGAEFLEYARQLLELSALAETRLQNITQGRLGRIRIAALSSSSEVLSHCLAAFYRHHPMIQVDVDILEGAQEIKAILSGSHDFYFAVKRMLPDREKYKYVVVRQEPLHFFSHRDHVASLDLAHWETIRPHPFVSVPLSDTTLSGQIQDICRNRGWKPNVINYYNRAEAVMLSVNAGVGVAILPASLGRLYRFSNIASFPIEGEDAITTAVIAWTRAPLTAAAEMFAEIVSSMYPGESNGFGK